MSRLILLCAPDQQARASLLRSALADATFAIDLAHPRGADARLLQVARRRSSCLLVAWSANLEFTDTPWRRLVAKAIRHGRCASVRLDRRAPAAPDSAIDLSLWRSSGQAPEIAVLRDRLGTCFRAARRVNLRHLFGLASIPLIAVLVGFIVDAIVIGTWFGDVPTAAEERSYQEALAQGCGGLRALVRNEPDNPRGADARRLLETAVPVRRTSWHPSEQRFPLYVAAGTPSPTRPRALDKANGDARRLAADLCSHYGSSGSIRGQGSRAALNATCAPYADGWRCSGDGNAICRVLELRTEDGESCR